MGYCGTDTTLFVEAGSEAEASEMAYEQAYGRVDVEEPIEACPECEESLDECECEKEQE